MEKIHNEELNDLYASPNIIRVIKSRRMRLAGHVARVGGGSYRGLVGNVKKRRYGDRGVNAVMNLRVP